jgi:hypothetical protein
MKRDTNHLRRETMTKTYEVVRRYDNVTLHTGTYAACCEYARRLQMPRSAVVVRVLRPE